MAPKARGRPNEARCGDRHFRLDCLPRRYVSKLGDDKCVPWDRVPCPTPTLLTTTAPRRHFSLLEMLVNIAPPCNGVVLFVLFVVHVYFLQRELMSRSRVGGCCGRSYRSHVPSLEACPDVVCPSRFSWSLSTVAGDGLTDTHSLVFAALCPVWSDSGDYKLAKDELIAGAEELAVCARR
jgi:hypothetical protein